MGEICDIINALLKWLLQCLCMVMFVLIVVMLVHQLLQRLLCWLAAVCLNKWPYCCRCYVIATVCSPGCIQCTVPYNGQHWAIFWPFSCNDWVKPCFPTPFVWARNIHSFNMLKIKQKRLTDYAKQSTLFCTVTKYNSQVTAEREQVKAVG